MVGQSTEAIADTLGIKPVTVRNVLNSPLVKGHIAYLNDKADETAVDIRTRIVQLAPNAVDVLENIMNSGSETGRLKAATDILDRGGYGAVQKSVSVNVGAIFPPDKVKEIQERINAAEEMGLIVDLPEAKETIEITET